MEHFPGFPKITFSLDSRVKPENLNQGEITREYQRGLNRENILNSLNNGIKRAREFCEKLPYNDIDIEFYLKESEEFLSNFEKLLVQKKLLRMGGIVSINWSIRIQVEGHMITSPKVKAELLERFESIKNLVLYCEDSKEITNEIYLELVNLAIKLFPKKIILPVEELSLALEVRKLFLLRIGK